MQRNNLRDNSGVTLVELLVALVVISLILVPILSFYNFSIRQNFRTQEETRLKFLAEEEMEKFVSLDYNDSIMEVYASTAGRTNFYEKGPFLIKTHVVFLDPETGEIPELYPVNKTQDTFLKKITVSVARKDKNGGQIDMVYFKSP